MISPSSSACGSAHHASSPQLPTAPPPLAGGNTDRSSLQGDALQRSGQAPPPPSAASPVQTEVQQIVQDLQELLTGLLGDDGAGDGAGDDGDSENAGSSSSPSANSCHPSQPQQTSTPTTNHSSPQNTSTNPQSSIFHPQNNGDAANAQANNGANTQQNPSSAQTHQALPENSQNATGNSSGQSSTATGLPGGAKNGDAIGGASTAATDMEKKGSAWYYNWTPSSGGFQAPNDAQFVPMIWGEKNLNPSTLNSVKESSSPYLLGFNEPDHKDQANMSVAQAVNAWPQLESTGKILGAPAVANADINNPNSWLNQFMSEAEKKNLRVDFIPLHWYGSSNDVNKDVQDLKNYVQGVEDKYHKPIWVTEMNLWNFSGGAEPTPAQQSQFAQEAGKMLDSLPYVQRYAVAQGS